MGFWKWILHKSDFANQFNNINETYTELLLFYNPLEDIHKYIRKIWHCDQS